MTFKHTPRDLFICFGMLWLIKNIRNVLWIHETSLKHSNNQLYLVWSEGQSFLHFSKQEIENEFILQ